MINLDPQQEKDQSFFISSRSSWKEAERYSSPNQRKCPQPIPIVGRGGEVTIRWGTISMRWLLLASKSQKGSTKGESLAW